MSRFRGRASVSDLDAGPEGVQGEAVPPAAAAAAAASQTRGRGWGPAGRGGGCVLLCNFSPGARARRRRTGPPGEAGVGDLPARAGPRPEYVRADPRCPSSHPQALEGVSVPESRWSATAPFPCNPVAPCEPAVPAEGRGALRSGPGAAGRGREEAARGDTIGNRSAFRGALVPEAAGAGGRAGGSPRDPGVAGRVEGRRWGAGAVGAGGGGAAAPAVAERRQQVAPLSAAARPLGRERPGRGAGARVCECVRAVAPPPPLPPPPPRARSPSAAGGPFASPRCLPPLPSCSASILRARVCGGARVAARPSGTRCRGWRAPPPERPERRGAGTEDASPGAAARGPRRRPGKKSLAPAAPGSHAKLFTSAAVTAAPGGGPRRRKGSAGPGEGRERSASAAAQDAAQTPIFMVSAEPRLDPARPSIRAPPRARSGLLSRLPRVSLRAARGRVCARGADGLQRGDFGRGCVIW
ncbi:Protein Piccolo [Manis pentadactyla]|nr:Protein Piccolo [Manis pentadactyla]